MTKIFDLIFKNSTEESKKQIKSAFRRGIEKHWGLEYSKEDIIFYEKQEGDKIVKKMGKIFDIEIKEAQSGNKRNRYYLVYNHYKFDENQASNHLYAVHEDCVLDGVYSEKRAAKEVMYNSFLGEAELKRKMKIDE